MTQPITLTEDQQKALDAFCLFMVHPTESIFVLSGYSGTGKSTLVKELLDRLPAYMKAARLIDPTIPEYTTELTATTNKAAENFAHLSGMDVKTIHSFLGLRVNTNYQTNVTTLIPRSNVKKTGCLLFTDEASYVDNQLLGHILNLTDQCKIVFIGDPAQLTPVKSVGTPVFNKNFTGAALNQVVRQAEGSPIIELSTKFRGTVNTGEFFSFKPDGHAVKHMPRIEFQKAINEEFTRPDWAFRDSKILVWTNKAAITHNHSVSGLVKGAPEFKVGDYAVCNTFVTSGRVSVKTDQMVQITGISGNTEQYGVPGNHYTIDGGVAFFGPKTLEAKNSFIKQSRENGEFHLVGAVENSWIDLRAAYACTINKSQGSTFDKVYIDLDDIRRCNSGDQIARMMYVGVSRARQQVFMTGDLV
jgi:hypothetical protein